ncbi:MAG: 6-hydroxymethyl-7,8-dihydropterin pyrophosphokinase, partial [Methanobacteriota archaeon]
MLLVVVLVPFEAWKPKYNKICLEMGYSQTRDRAAAQLLAMLLQARGEWFPESGLAKIVRGRVVVVAGGSASLEEEVWMVKDLLASGGVCLAADGATGFLLDNGVHPELVVTDLDGPVDRLFEANSLGSVILVHAHGDNVGLLLEHVQSFPVARFVVGSAQSGALPPWVVCYGGFTDGDRAVFLAAHLGAKKIFLAGMDFSGLTGAWS